jgi:hypothetical protein
MAPGQVLTLNATLSHSSNPPPLIGCTWSTSGQTTLTPCSSINSNQFTFTTTNIGTYTIVATSLSDNQTYTLNLTVQHSGTLSVTYGELASGPASHTANPGNPTPPNTITISSGQTLSITPLITNNFPINDPHFSSTATCTWSTASNSQPCTSSGSGFTVSPALTGDYTITVGAANCAQTYLITVTVLASATYQTQVTYTTTASASASAYAQIPGLLAFNSPTTVYFQVQLNTFNPSTGTSSLAQNAACSMSIQSLAPSPCSSIGSFPLVPPATATPLQSDSAAYPNTTYNQSFTLTTAPIQCFQIFASCTPAGAASANLTTTNTIRVQAILPPSGISLTYAINTQQNITPPPTLTSVPNSPISLTTGDSLELQLTLNGGACSSIDIQATTSGGVSPPSGFTLSNVTAGTVYCFLGANSLSTFCPSGTISPSSSDALQATNYTFTAVCNLPQTPASPISYDSLQATVSPFTAPQLTGLTFAVNGTSTTSSPIVFTSDQVLTMTPTLTPVGNLDPVTLTLTDTSQTPPYTFSATGTPPVFCFTTTGTCPAQSTPAAPGFTTSTPYNLTPTCTYSNGLSCDPTPPPEGYSSHANEQWVSSSEWFKLAFTLTTIGGQNNEPTSAPSNISLSLTVNTTTNPTIASWPTFSPITFHQDDANSNTGNPYYCFNGTAYGGHNSLKDSECGSNAPTIPNGDYTFTFTFTQSPPGYFLGMNVQTNAGGTSSIPKPSTYIVHITD